ncbi:hypothetical protein [uncultured Chryseobacterium sp.]|uniref:tetratricopeptide repeat protein n=1 Tax=uncultured Chryseobacterium sp. TaxID=259322 RepID=UPI0025E017A1|nr:hypothetical protein [uncultured Chryseobacterium sp.]
MNFKTEENKQGWIETSFFILLKAYGIPKNSGDQYLLNSQFFPNLFSSKKLEIQNLIQDLSNILDLNSNKISYEISKDLRDSQSTPYVSQGNINEIEITKNDEASYCITISNSIKDRQKQFIYTIIIEFIRIKLLESRIFEKSNNLSEDFLFLAGVYFGFGVILFENRSEVGTVRTGFWKKTWRFLSPVLPESIIYSFTFYQKLFPVSNFNWKQTLPSEILKNIDASIHLFDSDFEMEAIKEDFIINTDVVKSIVERRENRNLTATEKNNIGYRKLKEGLLEESARYFREAIQDRSNFGYANDNLGYTLILQGELEEGFHFLQQAIRTNNNNQGYSYRNLALYYHKKGNLAEEKNCTTWHLKTRISLSISWNFIILNCCRNWGIKRMPCFFWK